MPIPISVCAGKIRYARVSIWKATEIHDALLCAKWLTGRRQSELSLISNFRQKFADAACARPAEKQSTTNRWASLPIPQKHRYPKPTPICTRLALLEEALARTF